MPAITTKAKSAMMIIFSTKPLPASECTNWLKVFLDFVVVVMVFPLLELLVMYTVIATARPIATGDKGRTGKTQ